MWGRVMACISAGLLLSVLCEGCLRYGFTDPVDSSTPPEDARLDPDLAADSSGTGTDASSHDVADANPPDARPPDSGPPDSGGGPTEGLLLALAMTDDPSDGVVDIAGGSAIALCSSCPQLMAGAYHFSGTEYIEITPEARFETTTGFTVAIWTRPTAMGLFQVMASKLYGASVANSWHLSLRQATSCADRCVYETTTGSTFPLLNGPDVVSLDRWWHVAVTWDGSTKRLYLDGVLVASGSGITLLDGGPIYLGCDWDDGKATHLFHGALRDFRLYDRALDAAEIAQLTAGAVAGPPPPVPGAVTDLVLVDAANDTDIGPLTSPTTISLPAGGINIRAEVSGAPGSVRFGLDGNPSYRVENTMPFSLEGDANSDYVAWNPASGQHIITATPFCGGGASGTMGSAYTVELNVE